MSGYRYPSLAVTCPFCKVKPGEPCVTKGGAAYQGFHATRGDLAREREQRKAAA